MKILILTFIVSIFTGCATKRDFILLAENQLRTCQIIEVMTNIQQKQLSEIQQLKTRTIFLESKFSKDVDKGIVKDVTDEIFNEALDKATKTTDKKLNYKDEVNEVEEAIVALERLGSEYTIDEIDRKAVNRLIGYLRIYIQNLALDKKVQ